MARPTRKALALSGGALLLFLIGANIQAGWLYVLGASILGTVIAGLLLPAYAIRRLNITRNATPTAAVGDTVDVRLNVSGEGRGGRAAVEVMDHLLENTRVLVRNLPPKSSVSFDYSVTAKRRGAYEGAPVDLISASPFGIAVARRSVFVESAVIVHPRWVPISSFPVLEAASTPNEPFHERRRRGTGLDFFGIREYRSGDSLRHVHWRSSAKGGRLLVREYEEQPSSRLGILIDASEAIGEDPDTTFEQAVSVAASLVMYALASGHPVQLFCDSKSGTRHLFEPTGHEALDWLARVQPDGRRGLVRVAGDMIGEIQPRSTNVLIFASTRRMEAEANSAIAVLQSLSTRAVAIVLSAGSYAGGRDPRVLSPEEEERLTGELGAGRSLVYHVLKDRELSECLKEPLPA